MSKVVWKNLGNRIVHQGYAGTLSIAPYLTDSIISDSKGNPIIIGFNNTITDKTAKVKKFENGIWKLLATLDIQLNKHAVFGMAIDSNDNIYFITSESNKTIALHKIENKTSIELARINVDFSHLSLKISNKNEIFICSCVNGHKGLNVFKYSQNKIEILGNTPLTTDSTNSMSLAIDDNSVPYIMYYVKGTKIFIKRFINNTWEDFVTPFAEGFDFAPSLHFGSKGKLYLRINAKIYQIENKTATLFGEANIRGGNFISQIDKNDNFYISYFDTQAGGNLSVYGYGMIGHQGTGYIGSGGFSELNDPKDPNYSHVSMDSFKEGYSFYLKNNLLFVFFICISGSFSSTSGAISCVKMFDLSGLKTSNIEK